METLRKAILSAPAHTMLIRATIIVLVAFSTYFYGYHQGQNAEELARSKRQITELTETIKRYEQKEKEYALAMAELRSSESSARAESLRVRDRIAALEKRAKSACARDAIRHLKLEAEGAELLREAEGIIEYCRKGLR